MKLKFKKRMKQLVFGAIIIFGCIQTGSVQIQASEAGDKLSGAITDAAAEGRSVMNIVGISIAGFTTAITGIAALAIAIAAIWDTWRNQGAGEVFHKHGTTFFILLIIAVFTGAITAAFAFGG